MVNGNDIIEYEEANGQYLTEYFCKNILGYFVGVLEDEEWTEKNIYKNDDYWKFVEEEYGQRWAI